MLESGAFLILASRIVVQLALPLYVGRQLGLGAINFFTVPVLAGLPLLALTLVGGPLVRLEEGLLDPYFLQWVTIDILFTAVQILLAIVVFQWAFARDAVISPIVKNASPQFQHITAAVFLCIFVASFVLTASLGFGVVNWIQDPRTGYQLHREGVGPFYALMTTSLSIAALFLLLIPKHRAGIFVVFALLMPMMYLVGSKGFIVRTFIMAAAVYLLKFRRIPVVFVLIGGLAVSALMLANFGSADLIDILEYFDYYPNSTAIYAAISQGRLDHFYGQVSLSEFWGLVPRGLYVDKPFVYGQVILSDLLYPGVAEKGHTVAFGGPINAFADFGLPGVFIAAVIDPTLYITALLIGRLARDYAELRPDEIVKRPETALIILCLFNPDAFAYFDFPLNALYLLFVIGVVLVASKLALGFAPRRPQASFA